MSIHKQYGVYFRDPRHATLTQRVTEGGIFYLKIILPCRGLNRGPLEITTVF